MNCETARQFLMIQGYGELSFDEEEMLEQHLAACEACRAERASVEKLDGLLAGLEVEPDPALLSRCRRDLTARIQEEQAAPARFSLRRLWQRFVVHPPVWVRGLAAAALFGVGYFSAQLLPQSSGSLNPLSTTPTSSASPALSRVRYISQDESGQVKVVFDETQQRELTGSMSDERIRQLMISAASDPADPGLRVETVDLLKKQCFNDEVRQALLNALRTDSNAGVRLKALDGLKPYARDPETRKVIAQVLLSDDNPGVRIQAIDLLVQNKEPEVTGVLQESLRREDNSYVRLRTQRALTEMKASMGTF